MDSECASTVSAKQAARRGEVKDEATKQINCRIRLQSIPQVLLCCLGLLGICTAFLVCCGIKDRVKSCPSLSRSSFSSRIFGVRYAICNARPSSVCGPSPACDGHCSLTACTVKRPALVQFKQRPRSGRKELSSLNSYQKHLAKVS